jgi:diketogulonate reductase-like aldo/keto reductase
MHQMELGHTGEKISCIGQGTWGGDYPAQIDALSHGISLGMTFIDTAEMYGWGATEIAVGQVISKHIEAGNSRDSLFIASKVWGTNLGYEDLLKAADRSLKNLGISTIDLYQIHWPNPFKRLSRTMAALELLVKHGKIRYIGVSNFPTFYVKWAQHFLKNEEIVSNQVYFSLAKPEPVLSICEYAQKTRQSVIACSPLGGTKGNRLEEIPNHQKETILRIAQSHHMSFHQIALSWLTSQPHVLPIPKAVKMDHVRANAQVGEFRLSQAEFVEINQDLQKTIKKRIQYNNP